MEQIEQTLKKLDDIQKVVDFIRATPKLGSPYVYDINIFHIRDDFTADDLAHMRELLGSYELELPHYSTYDAILSRTFGSVKLNIFFPRRLLSTEETQHDNAS